MSDESDSAAGSPSFELHSTQGNGGGGAVPRRVNGIEHAFMGLGGMGLSMGSGGGELNLGGGGGGGAMNMAGMVYGSGGNPGAMMMMMM